MLESSLFESQRRTKLRNPATAVVSTIVHVAIVAALVLVPLLHTQALTLPPVDMSLFMPRVEQPRRVAVFAAKRDVPRPTRAVAPDLFTAPTVIPEATLSDVLDVAASVDLPYLPGTAGSPGAPRLPGIIGDRFAEITAPAPPATPPPVPPPPSVVTKTQLVRQSAGVQAANLIHQVKPVYPPLAVKTRTQGMVVLEATISREGSIESLRVVSGHPLLTQAAIDAVRQWKYRPTMLSGEPVDVITTITVTFSLQ